MAITIVCSSPQPDANYKDHVLKTGGNANVEFIFYENKNEFSLANVYNKGLSESKNDIVVFIHHDLIFDTVNWVSKLVKHFNNNDYGVIGVAGTDVLKNGCWWMDRQRMFGIVNHMHNGKKHTNNYSEGFGNKIKQTVIIDGLFMAVSKERVKSQFNEQFQGFHFYDIPFCVDNHLKGVKIGIVTDIRLTHLSIGQVSKQWEDSYHLFNNIYSDKLPIQISNANN